jgi:Tfp pilus assembly protein PilX
MNTIRDDPTAQRRCRGERGTAMVAALVLLFAFTAGGVIWLSRDVNRRVSNRSAAQSIAFQAARSGAQQVEVAALRDGGAVPLVIDVPAAQLQARRVADRLFAEYDVDGTVQGVGVAGVTVTVTVTISDPAGDVVGVGSARAEVGS